MFEPRFRPLIVAGGKCQTIRRGLRTAAPGELLSLRGWEGVPYRSNHYELIPPTPCLTSEPVVVEIYSRRDISVTVGDGLLSHGGEIDFVRADGFNSVADFVEHWREGRGLVKFRGRLITWAPPAPDARPEGGGGR